MEWADCWVCAWLERLIEELERLGAVFSRMDAVAQEFAQRHPIPSDEG